MKVEEFLTSVLPIPLEVIQEMRYNRSWNHIANVLNLIRPDYLIEESRKNIIEGNLSM